MKADWLADVLRADGLSVVERPGWKTRGKGDLSAVRGVILHHTGPTGSLDSAVHLIESGRIGGPNPLPGPLSQMLLDKDGTFHIIAAGRCNHAGPGKWQGVSSGNSEMLGIEARNAGDGREAWPVAQMAAYIAGVAAILRHIGAGDEMACGHKEWALPKGRKIDPNFDMVALREAVEAILTGAALAFVPARTDPARAMLRKGDHGDSVSVLQARLNSAGFPCGLADGNFGSKTDAALRAFQRSKGLQDDGKAGPKTWAALGVK